MSKISENRASFQTQLQLLSASSYLALNSAQELICVSFAQALIERGKSYIGGQNGCESNRLREKMFVFLSDQQKFFHATNIAQVKALAEKADLHTSADEKHKKLYHLISLSYCVSKKILMDREEVVQKKNAALVIKIKKKAKKVKKSHGGFLIKAASAALLAYGTYWMHQRSFSANHIGCRGFYEGSSPFPHSIEHLFCATKSAGLAWKEMILDEKNLYKTSYPYAIGRIGDELATDPAFVTESVSRLGRFAFDYGSKKWQEDAKLFSAAVEGISQKTHKLIAKSKQLNQSPQRLQMDLEINVGSVWRSLINYLPKEHKDVCLEVISKYPFKLEKVFNQLPVKLKKDLEIVIAIIRRAPDSIDIEKNLEFLPRLFDKWKDNQQIALEASKLDFRYLKYFDTEMLRDEKFVEQLNAMGYEEYQERVKEEKLQKLIAHEVRKSDRACLTWAHITDYITQDPLKKMEDADIGYLSNPVLRARILLFHSKTSLLKANELLNEFQNFLEADAATLKKHYRQTMLKLHPDKHLPKDKIAAEKACQKLNIAYAEILNALNEPII